MASSKNDPNTTSRFGNGPWYRFSALFGGLAALGFAVVLIASGVAGSSRGGGKFTAIAAIFGLVLIATSIYVRGVDLAPDGIWHWSYLFWFFGSRQFVGREGIRTIVLGGEKGKFNISINLADGTTVAVPKKWDAVRDAQEIVNQCTQRYGVDAGVMIADQAMLAEAAQFASAKRWTVTPRKPSRAEGELLRFDDEDGNSMGEVRLLMGWFQGGRVEIADGPGDLATQAPRWTFTKGGKLAVQEGERRAGQVEFKSSFTGSTHKLRWTDADLTVWSAVLTSENNHRTPFTLKFFKGLAEDIGSKADRNAVNAAQGEHVPVAIATGPAQSFTVDIADESAWPWVRIALASMWVKCRPNFAFQK